jgi:hypothetical protein
MPLYLWIAAGIAIAALVIGLIIKARLGEQTVWEELAQSPVPSVSFSPQPIRKTDGSEQSDLPMDSSLHLKSPGEEMNNPTASSRTTRDAELRRSSRIERPVSLVVLATNRRGENFQERTSAVSVNLHGCRYSSRHDIAPEGWVTLQVTGTDGATSRPVRARVRSIFSPETPRELCQVGVELETPGNVWGIPAPPDDWQRLVGTAHSSSRNGAAVAPAPEPDRQAASFFERQSAPAERRAEVTVFPGPPATPAPTAETSAANNPPPSKAERVVVTADQLLQILQGKVQLAAEKAVRDSLSAQLEEAVKCALGRIEDGWKAHVRRTEEFPAARLAEAQSLWEKDFAVYRSRAEEIASRVETLNANSQRALAETQKFVQRFADEIAPELHAQLNDSFGRARTEFEARVSLISAQHLAQFTEGSELAVRDVRSKLEQTVAEAGTLSSSDAAGASQEHIESLLNSFRAETFNRLEQRLGELFSGFEQQQEIARHRANDIAGQLEDLALETRQARSQQEQNLAEIRSLLSNVNPGIPQEHLDSLVNSLKQETFGQLEHRLGELAGSFEKEQDLARQRISAVARELQGLSAETHQSWSQHDESLAEIRSLLANANAGVSQGQLDSHMHSAREQLLSHLEWRLGEVSGHFENLLGQVRNRTDELARQLQAFSIETRGQLAENRSLAEQTSRDSQPQHLSVISQSVDRATEAFENAAARVSDRQLIRLMEQKHAVSQQVAMELEARASEARALLQRAANSTLEESRRRVETQIDLIITEATERVSSSIAALDAESRAAGEARRRALEADVARAAEQSTMEFRSGIKAFLYSCLVAAVSAVDQHAQTTLAGLTNEPGPPRALDATANSATADDPQPPTAASA